MQKKVHMQDQVTNRVQLIMNEPYKKIDQIADDIASLVLIVVVLSLGILW